LRYVLSQNGIDPDKDITIEWKSQPDEVVAVLSADENAIAMLPQPYVTVAQTKVEGLNIALDLTEEWDKLESGSRLITGTLVVNAEFAEKHPQLVGRFLEEYKASTKFVNVNIDEAAALVEEFDIVKAAIAKKAIPYCNITCITGQDMVEPLNGYLEVLYNENPNSVGGSLPGDDLYCILK
jgi:NitT/TauT family transport system substrate-binding protein